MRISIVVLLAFLVSGCQLGVKETVGNPDPVSTETDCLIGKTRLSGLLVRERTYLKAHTKRRQQMLKETMTAKDFAQSALLRSQPNAKPAEIKQALSDYRKQNIRPQLHCPGDRYLQLRQQQAILLLKQKQQSLMLSQENSALRRQIEALTRLEQELSRDRETPQ